MRPITGSWFEFYHHSRLEGKYYNDALRSFTEEQWRALINDMHSIGMDTLVLMCSSLVYEDSAESYAPVTVFPEPADMVCKDPIDVLMDETQKLGMKVFLSAGFYGFWEDAAGNIRSSEVKERAFRAVDTLYKHYKDHESFAGWYLPDETEAGPYFDEAFIDFVAEYAEKLKTLTPDKPILAAPYGTNQISCDDHFVDQLKRLKCDIVAWQDEVGVEKSTEYETGAYYAALRRAFDKAGGPALWADLEIFRFEGEVYESALLPADFERVRRQIEAISPYVDKILCYCYIGMMTKPGSIAKCGFEGGEKLYEDYRREFHDKR